MKNNRLSTPSFRASLFAVGIFFALAANLNAHPGQSETQRWRQHVLNVTITRDDWGIAHVVGKTDADAVFGMIYAQAEDDFNRVETNYLTSLGRTAEFDGENAVWADLRQRLFLDHESLKNYYDVGPTPLKKLMTAWADGLNYYLAKHPNVKPKVIKRFEPWMALSFTEGSIGGDIETINLVKLREFHDRPAPSEPGAAQFLSVPGAVATGFSSYTPPVLGGVAAVSADGVAIFRPACDPVATAPGTDGHSVAAALGSDPLAEPTGSNGIAIAPANTVNKKALLLINPHTSFFFRSELQMTSGEGLNAYGAVTWGQFFIYQGFNERVGWMHTSSAADAIDHYLETVVKKDGRFFYKHGTEEKPITEKTVTISYKSGGGMKRRSFTIYRTHHGPVIAAENGKWITISLMNTPVDALIQSYGRTKAKNYEEFKQFMVRYRANSSNNTIYADADGRIAYFHVNYVPRRDPKFDWTKPVDGSDPATDYKGLHEVDELPNLADPGTGWVYNTNNYPWSAAGPSSLKQADFPRYVDTGTENARGAHAIRLLQNKKDFTLESLNAAAYDSYLPWFERTIPALIKAYDAAPDPSLAEQIALLRKWDLRWGTDSVETSLAVFWAEDVFRRTAADARGAGVGNEEYIAARTDPGVLLESLKAATQRLAADFGKWNTPWGEINRFQRLTGDIVHPFSDAGPSIPVGFTSGNWGSLASFGARPARNTKKWYGTSGNSFVAIVEFGKTVRAKAVTAGGESGNPASKHFNDQAARYATGNLREVYFYPSQLKNHTARVYKPAN